MEETITNDIEELEKLEDEEAFSDDLSVLPPSDIVAYNELRSCADLLRMYQSDQLDIQPDFQRDVVWSNPAQTRFIDSLSKQLPIPSMCISLDSKTDKRMVIDGLQRITSIIQFLSNDEWKLSLLKDIDERISGKTVHTIKTKEKDIYSRVQNLTIPITVLRCDFTKASHNEYLFTIFHRLNTGGTKLNNQEIRNCIYNGNFNTLLKALATNDQWVKWLGLKEGVAYRFSNEEIILRFFAFYENLNTYNGSLAKFLNNYMYDHRNLTEAQLQAKQNLFDDTLAIVFEKIFDNKPIEKTSKATLEGLLIGIAKNLTFLKPLQKKDLKTKYAAFRQLPGFSTDNLKEGLSGKDKVQGRINAAIDIFSK
jgi:hypothetical protein